MKSQKLHLAVVQKALYARFCVLAELRNQIGLNTLRGRRVEQG